MDSDTLVSDLPSKKACGYDLLFLLREHIFVFLVFVLFFPARAGGGAGDASPAPWNVPASIARQAADGFTSSAGLIWHESLCNI